MITAIEHIEGKFVAAISSSMDGARRFLERCKDAEQFRLVETALPYFPIYLVEGNSGGARFTYTDSQSTIASLLSETKEHREDEDAIYFNVYRIRGPFTPDEAGRDLMGLLLHRHIDNDALDQSGPDAN